MCRVIYATDGKIYLYLLAEEDREEYMKLLRDASYDKSFYDDDEKTTLMWHATISNTNNIEYSIYDENGEFCGYVTLIDKDSETPEIGIEVAKSKQNKGLGPRAMELLAKQKYAEGNIEYFILRVSSNNAHSKHVVEKMGAEFLEEEQKDLKMSIPERGTVREEDYDFICNIIESYNKNLDRDIEVIHRYKYLPMINLFKDLSRR